MSSRDPHEDHEGPTGIRRTGAARRVVARITHLSTVGLVPARIAPATTGRGPRRRRYNGRAPCTRRCPNAANSADQRRRTLPVSLDRSAEDGDAGSCRWWSLRPCADIDRRLARCGAVFRKPSFNKDGGERSSDVLAASRLFFIRVQAKAAEFNLFPNGKAKKIYLP